jgi:uncharacterized protein YbaR (Trm112 family)
MKILACPLCKGELMPNAAGDGLLCRDCALIYPIRNGIPVMLPDEAMAVESDKAPVNSR